MSNCSIQVPLTSPAPSRPARGFRSLLFLRGSRTGELDEVAGDWGDLAIRLCRERWAVVVTGRVTVDTSPRLRSVLLEMLHRKDRRPVLHIDLSGVSYLDMSGLATLLEALKAAHQRAVSLRVTGINGQSRMLAEVAELDEIFRLSGSEVEFR